MANQKLLENNINTDIYDKYPKVIHEKLLQIRELIYEEADNNPEVNEIEESLKWGQPSFASKNKSGTPIRLGVESKSPDTYGLYVHCGTNLIESVRHIYGDQFTYDKNRGILFNQNDELPEETLRHVICMALTYHIS